MMNIINGILGIVLFSSFILIVYLELRKLEIKICAFRNGTLQDKRFSKLIEKAQSSNKTKFILYFPIAYGALVSIAAIIFLYPIEIMMGEKDISVHQFSFMFIWMFIVISVWRVIMARKVWTLCNQR